MKTSVKFKYVLQTAAVCWVVLAVCSTNGQDVRRLSVRPFAQPSSFSHEHTEAQLNLKSFGTRDGGLQSEPVNVILNFQQSLSTVGAHFVGMTIDTSMARENWATLDFSSKKLQSLAHALTPSYLRLGGTQADCMVFDPDSLVTEKSYSGVLSKDKRDVSNFTLSAKKWVDLNVFMQTVGLDFIMDLNALIRRADGSWDPSNARKLLQFSSERNFTIVGFELGNEYDMYKDIFNRTVTPTQLATDIVSLQKLLGEFPQYFSSFIVGPETAGCCGNYFVGFLSAGGANIVRASSYHHYYFYGKTAKLEQFTDMKVLDSLKYNLHTGLRASHMVNPNLPLWLSETSSAWGGGAPNISDRFVAGFLWLDKLGVSANLGVETVMRQDFYGINYGLIDDQLNPNPDYWLTLLYKRLVRGPVFTVTGRKDVRLYAACANTGSFRPGAVTVYFLNPNNYSVNLEFPQFKGQKLQLYILTSGDDNMLLSKFCALNGVKLQMRGDDLPPLEPKILNAGPVFVPPYSFGFLVLPDVCLTLCLL